MISTKNLISDLSEIPTGWPFDYYSKDIDYSLP